MTSDTNNENFFVTALRAYKANILTAALVAVGILAVDWLTRSFNSKFIEYAGPVVLVTLFAYAIHYTILFGTNQSPKTLFDDKKTNRFVWRSLMFIGVLLLILVLIISLTFGIVDKDYGKDVFTGWVLILFLVIGMPLFGASFALWGTMLPAAVAESDVTLSAAWHRAKGHFWYTFLRLVIGPFLVGSLFVATTILVAYLGVPFDFQTESGAFNIFGVPGYLIVKMADLFVAALTASVLCKTYLRSEMEAPTPTP